MTKEAKDIINSAMLPGGGGKKAILEAIKKLGGKK